MIGSKKQPIRKGGWVGGISAGQHGKGQQEPQKGKVERRIDADIVLGASGIVLNVFPEGDKAGQRGDQRAGAADVDTQQQLPVVVREMGQQDGRGNIADELAGQGAEEQRVTAHERTQQITHGIDASHVAGEDEEEHKGQQQRIIHHFQSLGVSDQQHRRDHNKADPIGDHPEHDDDGQHEQHQIQHGPAGGEPDGLVLDLHGLRPHEQAAHRQQGDGHRKGRGHDPHELPGGDVEEGVEVEILRVPEGGQHPAQIGGDVLHDEGKGHVALLAGGGKHQITQRQKGQQRHVVGNEHGADEGDIHQRQNTHAGVFEALDHLSGQHIEEVDILQRTDHRQHAEQARQRFQVKIAQIRTVRRDNDAGNGGSQQGDHHDHILFDECVHRRSSPLILSMQGPRPRTEG